MNSLHNNFTPKLSSFVWLLMVFLFSPPIMAQVTSSNHTQKPKDMRLYVFGHSLIVHQPPQKPTQRNETTVPHWMHLLSEHVSSGLTVDGQFGFLLQHSELPPRSNWRFDLVAYNWDPADNLTSTGKTKSFANADFTDFLITAGNFIQYQGPERPYDGDNPDKKSPVSATLEIVDWLNTQEPKADIYIYENWPDMASYGDYPASSKEFARYNAFTKGEFHEWWESYFDVLKQARPSSNIKMIPVGPIIAGLVTETALSRIPVNELYEDNAPHGHPNIYFLASLITHMAMNGTITPTDYMPPDIIHELIRNNMAIIVNYIWDKLNATDYGLELSIQKHTNSSHEKRDRNHSSLKSNSK